MLKANLTEKWGGNLRRLSSLCHGCAQPYRFRGIRLNVSAAERIKGRADPTSFYSLPNMQQVVEELFKINQPNMSSFTLCHAELISPGQDMLTRGQRDSGQMVFYVSRAKYLNYINNSLLFLPSNI